MMRTKAELAELILDRIVQNYRRNPQMAASIAKSCDEVLDPSGNLLGWIREASWLVSAISFGLPVAEVATGFTNAKVESFGAEGVTTRNLNDDKPTLTPISERNQFDPDGRATHLDLQPTMQPPIDPGPATDEKSLADRAAESRRLE